jgi:hypothetical protein
MFLPFHLTTLSPALNKNPSPPSHTHIKHFQFSIPQANTAAHTKQHFKDDQTGCLHPLNPTCVSLPLHHNFSPAGCSSSPACQCPGPACPNSLTDLQKTQLIQFHILNTVVALSNFQTLSNPVPTEAGDVSAGAFPLNITTAGNQVNISTGLVNTTLGGTVYSDD